MILVVIGYCFGALLEGIAGFGTMISPQNLTTGVSVTDLKGQEGAVFARTFPHSLVLTVALGVLVAIEQFLIPWIALTIDGRRQESRIKTYRAP